MLFAKKIGIFSLLFFTCTLCFTSFSLSAAEWFDVAPVPGGVALVDVPVNTPQAPIVHYGKRRVLVRPSTAGKWQAVVGVALGAAVQQTQKLRWRTADGQQGTVVFRLQQQHYDSQYINIADKNKVEPDARSMVRIRREGKRMARAKSYWDARTPETRRLLPPLIGRISGHFGLRRYLNKKPRRPHAGIDIAAPQGTAVRAPSGGTVIEAGDFFFNGNTIFLSHGQGMLSFYAHMDKLLVKKGQRVQRGQVIGTVGMTGRSTGPHLHWSVGFNGNWVNPLLLLPNGHYPETKTDG